MSAAMRFVVVLLSWILLRPSSAFRTALQPKAFLVGAPIQSRKVHEHEECTTRRMSRFRTEERNRGFPLWAAPPPPNKRPARSSQQPHSSRSCSSSRERSWLDLGTASLMEAPVGSWGVKGKWHEAVSLFMAWSNHAKTDPEAPVQMEALLARLVEEQQREGLATTVDSDSDNGNTKRIQLDIRLYNMLLDAWACAALFRQHPASTASQRGREILVTLQENYERTGNVALKPNAESFDVVLHVVCRTEGALFGRRLLAWMEHLYKTGKNIHARPDDSDYVLVLDAYAHSGDDNAGVLAEGFIRHMKLTGQCRPDTLCYNIAIKAWMYARRGREAAEHTDRILEEMKLQASSNTEAPTPDIITYGSVIAAWASSGMRVHAVNKVEALLREIEESPHLEVNTVVLNAVMSAWVKSKSPAAVERTEEIFKQMKSSPSSAGVSPDLISCNTRLHALSMHSKKRPENAQAAEDLLLEMEEDFDKGRVDFGPNSFSYNLVIEALCRAQKVMRALTVLKRQIQRDQVQPDTFPFNQVLWALSRSGLRHATLMAEELIQYMEKNARTGRHPSAKPDLMTYTALIVAYSRTTRDGAAVKAQALFDQLHRRAHEGGETHLKPNRVCYNALIDCWAKSGEGTLGARRAEALLQEMLDSKDPETTPNLVTFNAVLNAWARSGTRCCGIKAETYLNQMLESQVKPDEQTFNTVINAISRSQNQFKAQKALRVLRRMDKLYRSGYKEARPNEVTYTAVLNSCAFPAVGDAQTRKRALATAMFTLKELQGSRYGHPNQVTYGTFIKACANLLPDDEEMRREIIETAFRQCCQDGQVGEMVLNYLRKAAPNGLYKELLALVDSSRERRFDGAAVVSIRDLPPEWSCNVRERKEKWRLRRKKTVRSQKRP